MRGLHVGMAALFALALVATGCGSQQAPVSRTAPEASMTTAHATAARPAPRRRHVAQHPQRITAMPPPAAGAGGPSSLCYQRSPAEPDRQPSGPATQTVPDVTGEALDGATADLNSRGFNVSALPGRSGQHSCTIISESPPAGTKVAAGYTVTVLVSASDPATRAPAPPPNPCPQQLLPDGRQVPSC